MTNEFDVIGERKDDGLHLLVRGDDGQHYDYSVTSDRVSPVEPDDRWTLDHARAEDAPDERSDPGDEPVVGWAEVVDPGSRPGLRPVRDP